MTSHVLLVAFLAIVPLSGVELHLHYTAIERMLSEQMFAGDGRKYVRGDKTSKCSFAYLESPQVRGVDSKLEIRAKFTGQSALDLFGRCIGMGDAFDVVILAVPEYRDGGIGFREVSTQTPSTGFYARRVCSGLSDSLKREFKVPLAAPAKQILEDPGPTPAYKRELRKFNIPEVRVTSDALVLQVDFELSVR